MDSSELIPRAYETRRAFLITAGITAGTIALLGTSSKYLNSYETADAGTVQDENVLFARGQDPSLLNVDGSIYYTGVTNTNSIALLRADDVPGLKTASVIMEWSSSDHDIGADTAIWAPKLSRQSRRLIIDAATYDGNSKGYQECFSIETDIANLNPEFTGAMASPEGHWRIDRSRTTYGGKTFSLWSEKAGEGGEIDQFICIGETDRLGNVIRQAVISRPEYEWEMHRGVGINESPRMVVMPNGRVIVLYAAAASWRRNQSCAMLVLRPGGDPMVRGDWHKDDTPAMEGILGLPAPGVHDLVEDRNGWWDVYALGVGWKNRYIRGQRLTFDRQGIAHLGLPRRHF